MRSRRVRADQLDDCLQCSVDQARNAGHDAVKAHHQDKESAQQRDGEPDTEQIELWFNLGGTVKLDDNQSTAAALADLKQIQGLMEKLTPLDVDPSASPQKVVAAAEFLLEGLVAHRKLSRSEEHGFSAQETTTRKAGRPDVEFEYEDWKQSRRPRKGGFN